MDSPLLREWEGPVNIEARLDFGTGLPNDFRDQIDNEIVRRLGRTIKFWQTDSWRDFRFRKKVRLELICHVIMNLCPGCFTWDAQKMDCTADDEERRDIIYWLDSPERLKVLGLTPTGINEWEWLDESTGLFYLVPAQTSTAEVDPEDLRSPEEIKQQEHQASTAARFKVQLQRLRKKHTRKFLSAWLWRCICVGDGAKPRNIRKRLAYLKRLRQRQLTRERCRAASAHARHVMTTRRPIEVTSQDEDVPPVGVSAPTHTRASRHPFQVRGLPVECDPGRPIKTLNRRLERQQLRAYGRVAASKARDVRDGRDTPSRGDVPASLTCPVHADTRRRMSHQRQGLSSETSPLDRPPLSSTLAHRDASLAGIMDATSSAVMRVVCENDDGKIESTTSQDTCGGGIPLSPSSPVDTDLQTCSNRRLAKELSKVRELYREKTAELAVLQARLDDVAAPADKDTTVEDDTKSDGIVVAPTDLTEAPDFSCAQRKSIESAANTIGPKSVFRPQAREFVPSSIRMKESKAEYISVDVLPNKTSFDHCSGSTLARVQASFFVDPRYLQSILSYPTGSLRLNMRVQPSLPVINQVSTARTSHVLVTKRLTHLKQVARAVTIQRCVRTHLALCRLRKMSAACRIAAVTHAVERKCAVAQGRADARGLGERIGSKTGLSTLCSSSTRMIKYEEAMLAEMREMKGILPAGTPFRPTDKEIQWKVDKIEELRETHLIYIVLQCKQSIAQRDFERAPVRQKAA